MQKKLADAHNGLKPSEKRIIAKLIMSFSSNKLDVKSAGQINLIINRSRRLRSASRGSHANGYTVFFKEHFKSLHASGASVPEIGSQLGAKWRALSKEERAAFSAKAMSSRQGHS